MYDHLRISSRASTDFFYDVLEPQRPSQYAFLILPLPLAQK